MADHSDKSEPRSDFTVSRVGEARVNSPIQYSHVLGDRIANYVSDQNKILFRVALSENESRTCTVPELGLLERAGPRDKIYFNPSHVNAGVVTCGGLCPGLNDVIQAIVKCLWHRYGVRRIRGIRFGYRGLLEESTAPLIDLTPHTVEGIHNVGGSILGSSRGSGERTAEIVDGIESLNLNMLFVIGGDGTQKGALMIAKEIMRRKLKIAIIGVPKTIDNDLSFIQKSFGFETAVTKATEAVWGAHAEANSAINGIGLVKVMGRQSGFIAAHTAIASHQVDFVLVPEVPFELEGQNGLFANLKRRLARDGHAVIVVAEGAGQTLLRTQTIERRASTSTPKTDASGNYKLADIGEYLHWAIRKWFAHHAIDGVIKYINPSYIIRSAVATPSDSLYCSRLGNNAVHAAMAGRTKTLISLVNNHFVHLPISLAVSTRNQIDPESALWRDVLEATGQPIRMVNSDSD